MNSMNCDIAIVLSPKQYKPRSTYYVASQIATPRSRGGIYFTHNRRNQGVLFPQTCDTPNICPSHNLTKLLALTNTYLTTYLTLTRCVWLVDEGRRWRSTRPFGGMTQWEYEIGDPPSTQETAIAGTAGDLRPNSLSVSGRRAPFEYVETTSPRTGSVGTGDPGLQDMGATDTGACGKSLQCALRPF